VPIEEQACPGHIERNLRIREELLAVRIGGDLARLPIHKIIVKASSKIDEVQTSVPEHQIVLIQIARRHSGRLNMLRAAVGKTGKMVDGHAFLVLGTEPSGCCFRGENCRTPCHVAVDADFDARRDRLDLRIQLAQFPAGDPAAGGGDQSLVDVVSARFLARDVAITRISPSSVSSVRRLMLSNCARPPRRLRNRLDAAQPLRHRAEACPGLVRTSSRWP